MADGDEQGIPGGVGHGRAYFDADPAARGLGITLVDTGPGRATLRMTVRADMVNGHGTAHGGYLFLLADSAFACACNSHGPVTVASGADIDVVRPAREGDVLTATARERTRPGRGGIHDVTVSLGDDVLAEFPGRGRAPRS